MCKYAWDFRKLLREISHKCAKMNFEKAAQLVRNSEHTLKEIPRNVVLNFSQIPLNVYAKEKKITLLNVFHISQYCRISAEFFLRKEVQKCGQRFFYFAENTIFRRKKNNYPITRNY